MISNPSQTVCAAYLATCFFNGTSCATIPSVGACTTYTSITSADGCNSLSDSTPAACGFVSGASACSVRTCGDVIASPS